MRRAPTAFASSIACVAALSESFEPSVATRMLRYIETPGGAHEPLILRRGVGLDPDQACVGASPIESARCSLRPILPCAREPIRLDEAYERFDVLLGPTAPSTAFAFGAKADPLSMYLNDVFTIPSNLSGHPAMSVPFGVGDDGLPVGVQVLAPALQEGLMLRVAAALESAAP